MKMLIYALELNKNINELNLTAVETLDPQIVKIGRENQLFLGLEKYFSHKIME